MQSNEQLTGSIPALLRSKSFHLGVGLLSVTLFNIVDTYFAGLISTEYQTALTRSFPVFFLIIAIGHGLSKSTNVLLSNSIGAGDTDSAKIYLGQILSFGVILSVLLTAAGLLAAPWLFTVLGAHGETLTIATDYINIIYLPGAFFFVISFILSMALNAQGLVKPYRNYLVGSFLLNVILDPWFMFGGLGLPACGIKGIAWATVVIKIISCLYLLAVLWRSPLWKNSTGFMFRPRFGYYKDILKNGLPPCLNMLTLAVCYFIITFFIKKYGANISEEIAAYGIAARINQLVILPVLGLSIATTILVGQNNGARLPERVKETHRTALKYGIVLSGTGAVLIFILAECLMRFFNSAPGVIAVGVPFLRISAVICVAKAVGHIAISTLQGVKRPFYSPLDGIYRQILAPAVFIYILTGRLGWGLYGIWTGILIANCTAALFAFFYVRYALNKLPIKENNHESK